MSLEVVEKEDTKEAVGEGKSLQYYVDVMNALQGTMDLPGKKFAEKVASNIKKLTVALDPLNEMMKPSKEFEKVIQRVQTEAGGDPQKIAAIEADHSEVVKARGEQIASTREMLANKIQLKLYGIPRSCLPAGINARQILALEDLLY